MSSTKPKIDDKKSRVEKKKTSIFTKKNKNDEKSTADKNDKKKVIEINKNEIDDIFASAKSKKVSQPQESSSSTVLLSSSSSSALEKKIEEFVFKVPDIPDKSHTKRKLKLNDDDGFSDSRGTKNRKTTEDGLPIFDIKELNIGNGEDTPLCPFDCDCCF